MCGSKGSAPTPSGASTTSATNTSGASAGTFAQGPTPEMAQRYNEFLNESENLSNTPFNPAMLSSVAPLNAQQTGAINQLWNLGMTAGDFDPAKVRSIESPYIQDVVNASQDWFNNQNKIQANDLLSQGIRSGNAFGGDRMGVAAAQMAGQQQLAQAPVIAGLYQSGYTQALDEYNKLGQAGIQGAEEAIKAGTVTQAQEQRERDVATQNAIMQSAYPFQLANWHGAVLGGIGPLTGTVGAGTTQTTASSTGITNPPTPNPLTQALGLGSTILGLFGKDGGHVGPGGFGYASGGFVDGDDGDDGNYDGDDGSDDNYGEDGTGDGSDDTESEKEQKDLLHGSDVLDKEVKEQKDVADPTSGSLHVPRFQQPYGRFPRGGAGSSGSSTSGGGGSSAPAAQSASSSDSSGVGGAIGAIGGTIVGGPVGGVVGGALGRAVGSLFEHGGAVHPIHYANGDEVDDDTDDEDTGDTGDTGDTLDTGELGDGDGADQPPPSTVNVVDRALAPVPTPAPPAPPAAMDWLNPGQLGAGVHRQPLGGAPSAGADGADGADGGGGRAPRVMQLPRGGNLPPRSFGERWAASPFTQAGIAMLTSRSPYLAEGVGRGLAAATGAIERGRAESILDSKGKLISSGDTYMYQVGDQLWDLGIPTKGRSGMTPYQKEQIRLREKEIDRRSGASGTSTSKREQDIARIVTGMQKGSLTPIPYEEARKRAVWTLDHPNDPYPEDIAPKPKAAAPKKDEPLISPETVEAGKKVLKEWVFDPAQSVWKYMTTPSPGGAPATAAPAPAPSNAPDQIPSGAAPGASGANTAPAPNAQPAPATAPRMPSTPQEKQGMLDAAREKLKLVRDPAKRQAIIDRLRQAGVQVPADMVGPAGVPQSQ